MKAHEFMEKLDEAKIVEAIVAAERLTSGEIRVFISRRDPSDVMSRARARFEKLGMTKTERRNGVLIYFAPRVQKFAILGDSGIHEKCGPAFWEQTVAEISEKLRAGEFTGALVDAVHRVGKLLAAHFPITPGDRNELSDEILRD